MHSKVKPPWHQEGYGEAFGVDIIREALTVCRVTRFSVAADLSRCVVWRRGGDLLSLSIGSSGGRLSSSCTFSFSRSILRSA